MAASRPSQRLCVASATAKPMKAPVSMMPSSAMLTTPERSQRIPPRAARVSGVAVTASGPEDRPCPGAEGNPSHDGLVAVGDLQLLERFLAQAEEPAHDHGRCHKDDDHCLDHGTQVSGDLGFELHEAGPVA